MKVIFLDRDGTIIRRAAREYVDSVDKLEFVPGVIGGLKKAVDRGFKLVMVTNQEGLGTHSYPQDTFDAVQQKILDILEGEGVRFHSIFICPHVADENCECRKPKPGLVLEFLSRQSVDVERSFVIGDRITDVIFARNVGCKSVLLQLQPMDTLHDNAIKPDFVASDFQEVSDIVLRNDRSARVTRKTTETEITIAVCLDGAGEAVIRTGIGFFDHMLAQIAKHAGIDMNVVVKGDLHVDEHHTVEDTGLALGDAIRRALGEKHGIERYGFLLPMDESLAQIALDIGGRPYFSFIGSFQREKVGEFPTELVEDFFRAFADGLRANLHIKVDGRNDHHKIEAIFKGVARALRQAVAVDPQRRLGIPSTKGVL